MKHQKIILIKHREVIRICVVAFTCIVVLCGAIFGFQTIQSRLNSKNAEYVILAFNDLGMHCIQKDYSHFLILPPANNLKVQVFQKGENEARLINKGISVYYEILNNTSSADKVNFWSYAKDYGFDVDYNIGITGNGLNGKMVLASDKKYYEATAIPVVPYNDGSTQLNPYQQAKVTVLDEKSGDVLTVCESVIIPVSDEMNCGLCHGENQTDLHILEAHDALSDTALVAELNQGIRRKCSDCHKDNALSSKGEEGVMPLSQAMHGFHASKMTLSPLENKCYSCHPGVVTQCYRGVMYDNGVSCDDPSCHGSMNNIAQTQANGREAWLTEPDCGNCHGAMYQVNEGTLYRNSYLLNGPDKAMNNKILCASCHNSPHSEWPSTLDLDNQIPNRLQGSADPIGECSICHQGKGKIHNKGDQL